LTKRSLFAWLSWLLLFSLPLSAQNQGLDFNLYHSDTVYRVDNQIAFKLYPQALINLSVDGNSSREKRLNFNQDSKHAALNLNFSLAQNQFIHSLSSEYESVFDASDLEPSPYENKTAALCYKIDYAPTDSLDLSLFTRALIRREQDRYATGNSLFSRGYWLGGNLRGAMDTGRLQTGLRLATERKKLDWESFGRASLNGYASLTGSNYSGDVNLGFSRNAEDVYILVASAIPDENSTYQLSDTQTRNNLDLHGRLQADLGRGMDLSINDDFSQIHTNYSQNEIRNNRDYQNQLNTRLGISLYNNLTWDNQFGVGFARKEYNYNQNTRETVNRRLSSWLIWEYLPYDSLMATGSAELQMLSFPDDEHRWDSDLLNTSGRLGWSHYWHDRLKIGTWVGYGQRQEVYLDSLLSANNKTVSSISLEPSCQLLLGDQIALLQSYQLRADYSDYQYAMEGLVNGFYRQVGCKIDLIYDTYPYVARAHDLKWLNLPFRNSPHNSRRLDFGYAYEENQYADDKGSFYEMHTKNRRHTASLGYRHDIRKFYWSLTPRFSWGTWTEYSALADIAWEFNNGSQIEFSLSPYAEDLSEIDWRTALNLNLRF